MKTISILKNTAAAAVAFLATACSADTLLDEPQQAESRYYQYTLYLNNEADSRSTAIEEDGATVFFFFNNAESHFGAYARYSAEEGSWTLYSPQQLSANTFGKVDVYYFGSSYNYLDTEDWLIPLTGTEPIYQHRGVSYTTFGENSVSINTTLKPEGARLRVKFANVYYTPNNYSHAIAGISWATEFDANRGQFDTDESGVLPVYFNELNGDYYTPYYTVTNGVNQNEDFLKFYDQYLGVYVTSLEYGTPAYGMLADGNTATISPGAAATASSIFKSDSYYGYNLSDMNAYNEDELSVWNQLEICSANTLAGLHLKCKIKVVGVYENGDSHRNFAIRCECYDRYGDGGTKSFEYYPVPVNQRPEPGKEYDVDFSFFFKEGLDYLLTPRYTLYLLLDGVGLEVTNMSVTNV